MKLKCLLLFLFIIPLLGCGQSGKLYLPNQPQDTSQAS